MASISKLQHRESDRLSTLPDEIRIHILSHSKTRYAVRTSILSKRWRNIWANVPNLDFDDEDTHDEFGFKRFVNRVLTFHDLSQINKFRLRCCLDDVSGVERWIRAALRRNVVEVDVCATSDQTDQIFKLPKSVYTSETLKALTLRSNFIIDAPVAYDSSRMKFLPIANLFPTLKFLYVHLLHPNVTSMRNLFTYFPVLEDLTIDGTIGDDNLNLNINAPELKTLTICLCTEAKDEDEDEDEDEYEYEGSEYEGSEDDENEDHDVTGAYYFDIDHFPKLETLSVRVDVPSYWKLKFGVLPAAKVNIDLYDHSASEHPTFAKRASALLKSVRYAQYLSLSAHCLEACSLPSFDKLKEVKLVLQDCNRLESLLLKILEGSPNLECLILDREVNSCDCSAECSENPLEALQAVPLCLISKLKTISIMRFRGLPEEVEVVKYLLKNSQDLKTMTISTLRTNCGDVEKVHRNLCMCSRGSKTCKVEFM